MTEQKRKSKNRTYCFNCGMDAHCPEPLWDKTGDKICKKCDCPKCLQRFAVDG